MRVHKNQHLGTIGWAMLLAGAMSLGSCSGDETIDAIQGEAITFGNVFVEKSTRATDPSYGEGKAIGEFQVWGTVKSNTTGNTTGNTAILYGGDGAIVSNNNAGYGKAWACTETEYWIPSATYQFMAIVDGNKTIKDASNNDVVISTTTVINGMPSSITYNADGETDLLLGELNSNGIKTVSTDGSAAPTLGVNEAKIVDFTMSHLLSKVVFTFINADSETALKVKEIQLTGTNTSGTYTLATGQWNDTNTNYQLGFGAEVTIPAGKEGTSELERLIIPGSYEILGITFKVNNENGIGDEQTIEATIKNQTFTPGHSYNITANIKSGMKEIIFNVTSAAWGGTVSEDITIN